MWCLNRVQGIHPTYRLHLQVAVSEKHVHCRMYKVPVRVAHLVRARRVHDIPPPCGLCTSRASWRVQPLLVRAFLTNCLHFFHVGPARYLLCISPRRTGRYTSGHHSLCLPSLSRYAQFMSFELVPLRAHLSPKCGEAPASFAQPALREKAFFHCMPLTKTIVKVNRR